MSDSVNKTDFEHLRPILAGEQESIGTGNLRDAVENVDGAGRSIRDEFLRVAPMRRTRSLRCRPTGRFGRRCPWSRHWRRQSRLRSIPVRSVLPTDSEDLVTSIVEIDAKVSGSRKVNVAETVARDQPIPERTDSPSLGVEWEPPPFGQGVLVTGDGNAVFPGELPQCVSGDRDALTEQRRVEIGTRNFRSRSGGLLVGDLARAHPGTARRVRCFRTTGFRRSRGPA